MENVKHDMGQSKGDRRMSKKKSKKAGWIYCVRPRYRNKFIEMFFRWALPDKVLLIISHGRHDGILRRGRFFVNKLNRITCTNVSFFHLHDVFFYRLEVWRKPL